MTEKRYFKRIWEEEYYIFDSETISEKDFDEKVEYEDYRAFEDSMQGEEVVNRLNDLCDENEQLKTLNNAYLQDLEVLKSKVNDVTVAVEIATEEQMQKVLYVINTLHENNRITAKKCRKQGNIKKAIKFEESCLTLSVLITELKKELSE